MKEQRSTILNEKMAGVFQVNKIPRVFQDIGNREKSFSNRLTVHNKSTCDVM